MVFQKIIDLEQRVKEFEFQQGTFVKCHDCSIVRDDVCNHITPFTFILNVSSSDTLAAYPSRSRTRITVEDDREKECCECS